MSVRPFALTPVNVPPPRAPRAQKVNVLPKVPCTTARAPRALSVRPCDRAPSSDAGRRRAGLGEMPAYGVAERVDVERLAQERRGPFGLVTGDRAQDHH